MLSTEEQNLYRGLVETWQAQRGKDRYFENYYRGTQKITNLGIAIPPPYEKFIFPLNWCRTYVDVLTERQDVRMILRAGESAEDSELRKDFDYNNLATELVEFFRDLLIYNRAYLSVAADPEGGRPRIRVESPKSIAVKINPVDRTMQAGLRVVQDDTGKTAAHVLMLPNETILLSPVKGQMVEETRWRHDLGRVPLVMQVNRKNSDSWIGESQLTDLIPLVDAAARVLLNMQVAMEAISTPKTIVTGVKEESFEDENGKPVNPWDAYLGGLWALPDDAKVIQLPGGQLQGYIDAITMLAEQASTVTGLPVRLMGQNTANPAAEGAIRADESRLVKQVERLNARCGVAIAWALGIAERIRTGRWDADGQIQVAWMNPGTPTESQKADAMQKLAAGQRILSTRGALTEMGFTQARIDQELSWIKEEQNLMLL